MSIWGIWLIISSPVMIMFLTSAGLLTTLTGTIFYAAWLLSGSKLDETGGRSLRFRSLAGISLFYLVPAAYIILMILDWPLFYNGLGIGSEFQLWLCICLFIIWAAGFLVCTFRVIRKNLIFRRQFRDCMECEMEVQKVFDDVCRELGVREGRVLLQCSYQTEIPFQTGLRHPRVILPVKSYTEEKLRVIFSHELTHIRQRALLVRKLAHLAALMNWYNYTAWKYYRTVIRWTEYECDAEAEKYSENEQVYYAVILDMAMEQNGIDNFAGTFLFERRNDVVDRIRQADVFHGARKRRWLGRIIVSAMLGISVLVSATAAYAYGVVHIKITDLTFEGTELEPIEVVIPEVMTAEKPEEGFIEEFGEMEILSPNRANYFEWTVASGTRKSSGYIAFTAGQTVTIAGVIAPAGVNVKIGLLDSANHVSYVTVQGNVYSTFVINSTDNYRFFVENNSGTTVTVGLSMIIF